MAEKITFIYADYRIEELELPRIGGYRPNPLFPKLSNEEQVLVDLEKERIVDQIRLEQPLVYFGRNLALVDFELGTIKDTGLIERIVSTKGLREVQFSNRQD